MYIRNILFKQQVANQFKGQQNIQTDFYYDRNGLNYLMA